MELFVSYAIKYQYLQQNQKLTASISPTVDTKFSTEPTDLARTHL